MLFHLFIQGARLLYERESRIVIEYGGLDDKLTDVSVCYACTYVQLRSYVRILFVVLYSSVIPVKLRMLLKS